MQSFCDYVVLKPRNYWSKRILPIMKMKSYHPKKPYKVIRTQVRNNFSRNSKIREVGTFLKTKNDIEIEETQRKTDKRTNNRTKWNKENCFCKNTENRTSKPNWVNYPKITFAIFWAAMLCWLHIHSLHRQSWPFWNGLTYMILKNWQHLPPVILHIRQNAYNYLNIFYLIQFKGFYISLIPSGTYHTHKSIHASLDL